MPWSLKDDGIRYSKKERKLFSLLPQDGSRVDTHKLLKGLARKANGIVPFHARTSLVGAMRSLIEKVDLNKEKFKVCKSERSGPNPSEFWVERR